MIDVSKIVSITSEEHYVNIQIDGESLFERRALKQFESLLDSKQFCRIHRSTIINLDFLEELEPITHGDYSVLLKDGSRHVLSRRYSSRLGI
jgi:two-component system, LytTR family, response regulator